MTWLLVVVFYGLAVLAIIRFFEFVSWTDRDIERMWQQEIKRRQTHKT